MNAFHHDNLWFLVSYLPLVCTMNSHCCCASSCLLTAVINIWLSKNRSIAPMVIKTQSGGVHGSSTCGNVPIAACYHLSTRITCLIKLLAKLMPYNTSLFLEDHRGFSNNAVCCMWPVHEELASYSAALLWKLCSRLFIVSAYALFHCKMIAILWVFIHLTYMFCICWFGVLMQFCNTPLTCNIS